MYWIIPLKNSSTGKNDSERKQTSVCLESWRQLWVKATDYKEAQGISWCDGSVLCLSYWGGYAFLKTGEAYAFLKTSQTVHLNWVHFTVGIVYPDKVDIGRKGICRGGNLFGIILYVFSWYTVFSCLKKTTKKKMLHRIQPYLKE